MLSMTSNKSVGITSRGLFLFLQFRLAIDVCAPY